MALTDKEIKSAITTAKKSGKEVWVSDVTGKRVGWVLQLRASSSGNARWYFRYTDCGSKRRLHSMGTYPEMGLVVARAESAKLAQIYQGDHNLKAVLLEQEQLKEDERRIREEARLEAERKREDSSKVTVGALMDLYVADLKRRGKDASAGDAQSVFMRHAAHLRSLPASALTRQHVTDTLRKVVESGKGRTAGVLRSYLAAAFRRALDAEDDASIPTDFLIYRRAGLERNPAAETKALTQFIKPRERYLNDAEFRHLWRRLADAGIPGMTIQSAIALGGQRIAQLLRAQIQDVDDDGILTLRDPKGRRTEARLHYLPLAGLANDLIRNAQQRAKILNTNWLFSIDGSKAIHPDTLTHLVSDLSKAMLDAGEANAPLQMKDIRRTVETTLSRMGVSESHRAQLQSHGLSGVQARHYDKHNYLAEKKSALLKLTAWIEGYEDEKIVPFARNVA